MILTALEGLFAFILALGPLVFIHELGHFLVAKAFGVAVPVFSIGFGPRIFGFKRGETDYRISAIPLGGYVRMAGDEADENRQGLPHEFLSKPKWQRFFVFVAGAAFNIILAFLVSWFIFAQYGRDEIAKPGTYPVVLAVSDNAAGEGTGVRRGDKLIEISGRDVIGDRYFEVRNVEIFLSPNQTKKIALERDGKRIETDVLIEADPNEGAGMSPWALTWTPDEPAVIYSVGVEGEEGQEDLPAAVAGLKPRDRILGAGARDPISEIELRSLIEASPGLEIPLRVEREVEDEKRIVELVVTPRETDGKGKIGVLFAAPPRVHLELSVGESARAALQQNVSNSVLLLVFLKRMVTREMSAKSVSGPIGIARVARQALLQDLPTFLWFVGFVSLQLGILNLLPIPVLDGGHIVILGVEAVMRRELSEPVKEKVMTVGFVFLLALMAAVFVWDFMKLKL